MISLLCTDITSLTVAVAKCQSVLLEWHFDKGLYGVTFWQAALKHYRKNKRFNFCQHLSPCDEELLEWATIITDHYHRSWWLNRYMHVVCKPSADPSALSSVNTSDIHLLESSFVLLNSKHWLTFCILTRRQNTLNAETLLFTNILSRARMVSLRPKHSGHWGHDPLTSPT